MKILQRILFLVLLNLFNVYSQNVWVRTNGLDSVGISSISPTPNGNTIAGTDTNSIGCLFRSTNNGGIWTNLEYLHLKITGFVNKPSGEMIMSTLDHQLGGGVFHSYDDGITWTQLGYTGASTAIAMNSNGDLFIGTLTDGVFRSTDDGSNWIQINQGLTDTHPLSLTINSSGDIFVGTIGNGVFRSTDNGNNWVLANQGITNNQILSLGINSYGHLFAGTSGGGVYRSTDNGSNWTQINQGLTSEGSYILSLLINSGDDIFAGTAEGVFHSTNNGDNWIQINPGLTDLRVNSLTINSSGYIFAGTGDGVFQSINPLPVELSSFTLKQLSDKIQLNWWTKTEVNNYGFEVERCALSTERQAWEKIGFVAGNGNSNSPKEYSYLDKELIGGSIFIYRLKQIDNDGQFEYSKEIEVEMVPDKFVLYQNYPNPFNPTTKIRYKLPNASKVIIKVYNILGSEVIELLNEQKEAGIYEAEFNSDKLSSGTYFYKINTDNFVQIKKMILQR
jgi:hypothetical protein